MAKRKKRKGGGADGPATRRPGLGPSGLPWTYQVLVTAFILVAAIAVLYPELVFEDKLFVAGDVESAVSLSTPIKKAMAEGEYPQWNPYLFSGMPSYASLSYLPHVYPLTAITGFLITYLKFPNYTWLLFHVFLLGLGVWLLLVERGVHFLVAVGVGVLMMWMPNHVAIGVNGHGSQASSVGYMPFALFFWDRLWRGKGVMLNTSVLVILLGFQLLRGHLQISYYTFSLIGLHLIFFGALRLRDAFRCAGSDDSFVFGFLNKKRELGSASAKQLALADVGGAVVVLGVIVVGALAISSVLFLPVHDYAQYSIRGATEGGGLSYEYATSWSLHPLEAVTFIIPFAFGFGKFYYYGYMPFTDYPNYVGVVVAFFAIVSVLIARNRFISFLAFIVIITTLVAFGKHLPILYGPLFKFLPYFNKFRVPVMVLIVQQLALVLMCGLGISALLKYDRKRGERVAFKVVLAAVITLVLAVISYGYWSGSFAESVAPRIRNVRTVQEQLHVAGLAGEHLAKDLIRFSLLFLAVSSIVWLFLKRKIATLPFALLILGIGAFDTLVIDRHITHPEKLFGFSQLAVIKEKAEGNRVLEPDALTTFLEQREGYFRVFPMNHPSRSTVGDFETNRYMNFGIGSIGGYHPAKLVIYKQFIDALELAVKRGDYRMADMLNVRYVISSNPLPEDPVFKPVWSGTDYKDNERFVYENQHALPRVFFVDRFEVQPGGAALSRLLTDPNIDVSQTALLEGAPSIEPVSAVGATASITDYRFNEIRVKASLPSDALMVMGEIYYPSWQVAVDDEPGEIIRANHILRAIPLAAGEHELVFRYDTSLLRRSLVLTVSTFSVAMLALILSLVLSSKGRLRWKHS